MEHIISRQDELIINALKKKSGTTLDIAEITGLTERQVSRRMSGIYKSNMITIIGTKKIGDARCPYKIWSAK